MRGRELLKRTPVAARALRTLDEVRGERDRLRRDRDRLRRRLEEAERHMERLQREVTGTRAKPPALLLQPSFLARTETLRRVRQLSNELNGHSDPVWAFNGKLAGNRLAEDLGLNVPRTLAGPAPLPDLTIHPSYRCVVKPMQGAGGHGVAPLVPIDDGRWLDLFQLEKGARHWDEIREELASVARVRRISRQFFVEELLQGRQEHTLPYDWKLFCVGGEVVVAFARDSQNQRHASGARFRYFSPDWQDLGPIGSSAKIDRKISEPQHPDDLIRAAEAVAKVLPTPFVRVDLYDTPDGVYFGELTPQPGIPTWFGPDLDRSIGERWDRAEARAWKRADARRR